MKKRLVLFLVICLAKFSNAQTCTVKYWNHIDCQYGFGNIGFYVDTINSQMLAKDHYHSFSPGAQLYGCWGLDADTQDANFNCGSCGSSDTDIFNLYFLPLSSHTYKYFSIGNGSGSGKKMFDWNDIINYKRDVKLSIPDEPYCCTVTIPAACSSCNCGVAMVDWKEKEVALLPAWGIYWENNCPVITN